jgi:hypothetical protein
MSLIATMQKDGTAYPAPTGGADLFLDRLYNVGQKIYCTFIGDTDFTTRRIVEMSVKDPQVQASAPGGYTQSRESVILKKPIVLANGNRTVCTLSISMATDPELTLAQKQEMRYIGAQLLTDTELSEFWESHQLF